MPTAARLRELLDYSPETGEFVWRVSRGKARRGDVAGCLNAGGYRDIRVDGVTHLAHRLAVLHMTGEWPQHEVDHINGNRDDNRAVNLRDVPIAINRQNQRRAHLCSKSQLLGVSWNKRKRRFRAAIDVFGKKLQLGYFTDPQAAHAAYLKAKRDLHPGCAI